jgi:alcohol dehydrogenase
VVLQARATVVCRSDWHGWGGHDPDIHLPHVPGHEFAGNVVARGRDVKRRRIGDRVTVPFVAGWGACAQCHSGIHQVCDYQFQPGFTHWGSFAQYVAIQQADINLVALPPEPGFATAASLGSHGMQAYRYDAMLVMMKNGRLAPQKLVGRTIDLEQSIAALMAMERFENAGVTVVTEF